MPQQKINFEERAVAFIDVLGFSALVNKASTQSSERIKLQTLVDSLEAVIPLLNTTVDDSIPNHLIPKHNYISDCIILSAPLADKDMKSYCGLSVLVMRVIQITHRFLENGYLISGGISIGKVWHTESNIIGPAYQEAFKIESLNYLPCVILSKNASKHWETSSNFNSTMCLKHNRVFKVNGIHSCYMQNSTEYGVIKKTYGKYKSHANKQVSSNLPHRAKRKWQWFYAFLNKFGF